MMNRKLNIIRIKLTVVFLCIVCFFPGCETERKEKPTQFSSLIKLKPHQYPEFKDDLNYSSLAHAIKKSLIYYNKIPSDRKFYYGKDIYAADHIIKSFEVFLTFR